MKNSAIADNKPVKIALAKGVEVAGTAIGSGETGMLAEEQAASSHYLYELASARFGYRESLLEQVQAFHFKGGQAANTGTGDHLPGNKNTAKIAAVRGVAFALGAGADYIMLDGRGGRAGAAPLLCRDHTIVPAIPALANSVMQAAGCIGARICNSNNCAAGIATQKPELRRRLKVEQSAQRVATFLTASVELMQVMARACGHRHLRDFEPQDLTTVQSDMA